MKHQDQRTLRHPHVLIILHFLFFIGLFGGVSPISAEGLPEELSAVIYFLSKYKSNAEDSAIKLEKWHKDNVVTKDVYHKGQDLYNLAKNDFNGWIDSLIFEIKIVGKDRFSPDQQKHQKKAKTRCYEFTKYVKDLEPREIQRGVFGRTLRNAYVLINDIPELILEGISNANADEKLYTVKQLEKYKWFDFHFIEKSRKAELANH